MRYPTRSALIPITLAMLLGSGPALAASNACKADLTADGVVNFADLAALKSVFFQRCNDPGPTCGDGIVQVPEQCDDSDRANGDGCSDRCTIEVPPPVVCGNGIAQGPTESCDDGNLTNGDGCSSDCTLEPARHFPATGQATCWNSGGTEISCAGTGQDGEFQAGATLAYVDNGDGTITDSNTGLMWEKLSSDGTIHDKYKLYTWDVALFHPRVLNIMKFAGHADWRLPNIKELQSIVNYQNRWPAERPAVSPVFDTGCLSGWPGCTVTSCSCTLLESYWSSTSIDYPWASRAFGVNFFSGSVIASWKTDLHRVRAVRGGP